MERAVSFAAQLEGGLFASNEEAAKALGVAPSTMTKLVKAAQVFRHAPIATLLPDCSAVPVDPAYKLTSAMDQAAGAKEVVLRAAKNLGQRGDPPKPGAVLKALLASLSQTRKIEPLRRQYNLGKNGRIVVSRNAKGKVTLALNGGLTAQDKDALHQALDQIIGDFTG